MADRAALRELQTRLASRLLAARTQGLAIQWLAVEVGGGRYLFPLAQAGEIFPWSAVQAAPYTRPWFMGVANLRGNLCGVVDLAHFLDLDGVGVRNEAHLAETRLVTLGAALGVNCALMVDQLAGLRGTEAFVDSTAPPQGAPAYFSRVHIDAAGLRWQALDLLALSQSPSFLAIGA